MDFDLDYRYALDCEINPMNRRCDSIRSQLLQLVAKRNSLPPAVYLERQADLLKEYSSNVDKKNGLNSYVDLTCLVMNHEKGIERKCSPKKWKFGLKQRLEDSTTFTDLFSETVPSLRMLKTISAQFKKLNKHRKIQIEPVINSDNVEMTDENENQQTSKIVDYIQDQLILDNKSPSKELTKIVFKTSSPTHVPGLFKNKGQSNFTRSLFAKQTNSQTTDNSQNSQDSVISIRSDNSSQEIPSQILQKPIQDKNDNNENGISKTRKKSFMTGLEKHLVDQVMNNGMDKNQARKIIEDVRKENPQSFRDPMKKIKLSNCNGDTEHQTQPTGLAADERLKGIEPAMIELIQNEIIYNLDNTDWSNIAGLEYAKGKIQQVAILPLKRPDLFTGIRAPPKGILLFGPPGTGKTMLGRCIASHANATFFSITSSTLTSKWIGDGEKAMKTMFQVARCLKPSVIFIDEVDSLLKSRSDSEHESSRRMKTEFLAQFDGLSNQSNDGLLVIGTTNRPQELDEAVRRRFAAKLYIPLPQKSARKQMIMNNLKNENHCLTDEQIDDLADKTNGYSGSDMKHLCSEAAMYSFKEIMERLADIEKEEIRAINFGDFQQALATVKPSFSIDDLQEYENWNKKYGSDY